MDVHALQQPEASCRWEKISNLSKAWADVQGGRRGALRARIAHDARDSGLKKYMSLIYEGARDAGMLGEGYSQSLLSVTNKRKIRSSLSARLLVSFL